jgi:hypothetical protein
MGWRVEPRITSIEPVSQGRPRASCSKFAVCERADVKKRPAMR